MTALLVTVGGLGALAAVTAPPAQAVACTTAKGVTVVVDFGRLGGGVRTGCASAPGTGLSALSSTGHSYTFVPRQAGLVCTLDRRPDPCNSAPLSAYWSYWHASPGGTWSYSTSGAGSHHPKAGSVEGWAFGAGRPPGVRPPSPVKVTKPPTRTTTTAPTRTTRPTTTPTSSGGTAQLATGPDTSPPSASVAPAQGSASVGSTTIGSTTAPSASTDPVAPSTPPSTAGTSGSGSGPAQASGTGDTRTLGLGALLVVGVGGGAGLVAWRRRTGR